VRMSNRRQWMARIETRGEEVDGKVVCWCGDESVVP
jgi:hypothetical protein